MTPSQWYIWYHTTYDMLRQTACPFGCIQEFWRQVQRLDRDQCVGEHDRCTRLDQSTAVRTGTRSAQAQQSLTNAGGVGDWPSLDRHEDIGVSLADHAENTTGPLFVGLSKILGAPAPLCHADRVRCPRSCTIQLPVRQSSPGENAAGTRRRLNGHR